jgi:hypothetical protein
MLGSCLSSTWLPYKLHVLDYVFEKRDYHQMEVDLMMLELLLLFAFRLVKVILPEFHFNIEFDIVFKIKKHNL